MDVRVRHFGMGGENGGGRFERAVPDTRFDEMRRQIHHMLTYRSAAITATITSAHVNGTSSAKVTTLGVLIH